MSTVFSYQKIWRVCATVCLAFALFFTTGACFYAVGIHGAERYETGRVFYYLVSSSEYTQASAHFNTFDGGAGYLLSRAKTPFVAYAVYFDEDTAETARQSVGETGVTATVIALRAEKLYFKTSAEKRLKSIVVSALEVLYANARVLYETTKRLDTGWTQESVKRSLRESGRRFSFLSDAYAVSYPSFAKICKRTAMCLLAYEEKTVYARELRGVLCRLSEEYLLLCDEFAI